jgi:hypothetical protein
MNFRQISKTLVHALVGIPLFVALGGIAPGVASQVADHDAKTTATDTILAAGGDRLDSLAPQNAKGDWTCPMHPEIHRHAPGKCPVCKMKLIKAKPKNG